MNNRYVKHSHVSERQTRLILKCFALDLDATQTASLTGVSRPTINRFFGVLRERVVRLCEEESSFDKGTVEFDESRLDEERVRDERERGAGRSDVVFGLTKREGKIYGQVLSNCSATALYSVATSEDGQDPTRHRDEFKRFDALVDFSAKRLYRICGPANGRNHIDEIESFWGLTKARLAKFRGISAKTFYLHLKESEFRFNHRNEDLYKILLKELRTNVLALDPGIAPERVDFGKANTARTSSPHIVRAPD